MSEIIREFKRKNHLYSSESDLYKIVQKRDEKLKPLYPDYAEKKISEFRITNGIYSDETCLEKITSDRYISASSCKDTRERDRKEAQKRLVKIIK